MSRPDDGTTCKLTEIESAQASQGRSRQLISGKPGALVLVSGAYVIGGSGMLAWLTFLLLGPPVWVNVNAGTAARLLIDLGLCLIFFVQHSLMVRKRFRLWLTRHVRADFHGALYATAAGTCLLLLVLLWHPVGTALWAVPFWVRTFCISLFLAAGLAAGWGARSLGEFDALGVKPALAALNPESEGKTPPFVIRGPYRWVRHPLYLFSLIIIWSGPVFTLDRLLHNVVWTIWIWFGAIMEERDLAACFGDAYRSYQQKVPMLIPKRLKPSITKKEAGASDRR